MSWPALLLLSAISYGLKAIGPVFAGGRQLGARLRLTLDLVAVPLLSALIVTQTAPLLPDLPRTRIASSRRGVCQWVRIARSTVS